MVKYDIPSFDLDIDLITLILKLVPDMVKMYLHTQNEDTQTVRWTNKQTDLSENIIYPPT